MRREDFHYDLPAELIAQTPLASRSASRLLYLPAADAELRDLRFGAVGDLLTPGDLLVVNDTRVLPARLLGRKASGGRVELLLERLLDERRVLAQLRANRTPATGARLEFADGIAAHVTGRQDRFFVVEFEAPALPVFEAHGHVPLPPYIGRADEPVDRERYQTVYAHEPGAVAAPTAGLHFDAALLDSLAEQGIGIARITLHVGAGTFLPLDDERLASGRLHSERYVVPAAAAAAVATARAAGGRVIAVGTTVVRALESAVSEGRLLPGSRETDLFIRPGFEFRVTDAMITNFHLPESSLLMLVCAFAGTERVLAAYRHAVEARYRFFSYGDAMFVERQAGA